MPADLHFPTFWLMQFLLLLCRTAGLLVFIPIPGLRSAVEIHRLVLAGLFAFLLLPHAPPAAVNVYSLPAVLAAALSEAGLGVCLGLAVSVIQEGILLGAQMAGLQAGYSYASTIDPNSNADTAILQVLLNLGVALMFLALGLDTVLFRFLLDSARELPAGAWKPTLAHAGVLIQLLQSLFTEAIRTAIPVIGLLLLLDVAMSLLSRMQPQLQLLSLSFPVKMLAALLIFASLTTLLPGQVARGADRAFAAVRYLVETPRK
jgi:flagellar biosynthesis protein FliR